MRLSKENLFLILIILLAALLRFINLSYVPIGFNDDEAAFGYNAFSILKTGRDEWGRFLPFPVFESFGDWKLVVYLYLTVISQFIFGVNEFATRFPSALFGVMAVLATYLLTKKLFSQKLQKDSSLITHHLSPKNVALLAAFFLAISPWHIIASRNAFESDILVFFITMASYFFLVGLKKRKCLTYSSLFFVVSFYTYRSSWLFVPLYVSSLIYFYKDKLPKIKKEITKSMIISIVLLAPLIPTVLTFKGQSRFFQESFISGTARIGIFNDVNEKRGICYQQMPQLICTAIYNKYSAFIKLYVNNYFGNLSYKTYFENANPTGFQSFAKRSVFYAFELPLLIIGIVLIFKQKSQAKILLAWILLVPVGASIAGIANYGRINILMPAPQIIEAFAALTLLRFVKLDLFKKLFVIGFTGLILFSLINLYVDLFLVEPYFTSRYQRYGYKQMFNFLAARQDRYQWFFVSRKIDSSHQYIQYLYFQKIDPQYYFENSVKDRGSDGWIELKRIGNFVFVPSVPGLENIPSKTLLVVGEGEVLFPNTPIFTIDDLRGDRLFEVYDVDFVKQKLKELEQNGKAKATF